MNDSPKRCLITGGAGFIGSHIADALVEAGHHVAILDDLSTGKTDNLPEGVTFYNQSVLDNLWPVFETEQPEYVFHQAAQISVSASVRIPEEDAQTNIIGTIHLLEACRAFGIKRVMYASTAASYGNATTVPYQETDRTWGISPYGISKYVAERYLYYYRHHYGLSYAALRYANVFGPRQDPHGEAGVVAIFSQRLLADEACTIFGDGGQCRDFVYVKDIARANLAAMTALVDEEEHPAFNISTAERTTVNELYAMIAEAADSSLEPVYEDPRPGDPYDSCLNNTRAREVLQWSPRTPINDGIRETVAFFKGKKDGTRVR